MKRDAVALPCSNCGCPEIGSTGPDNPDDVEAHYVQDVRALVEYGFDGVKFDACGRYMDTALYARLLNESGRQVLIENCHWGMCEGVNGNGLSGWGANVVDWSDGNTGCPEIDDETGSIVCPFHFFRTSGDIDASAFSWLRNLESTVRFLDRDAPLAGRGCWAYPDM